ncbi:MAG: hypothetical protein LBQ89_05635 [Treponema sp.]|jgi:hypothetical protein|nr:hypothetical protein [Treponema sp.]
MQSTVCDICKKKIDKPLTGCTVFYYAKHSVCESCKDNLENTIKNQIRNKEPFAIEWYDKFVDDSIVKAIQKGKS